MRSILSVLLIIATVAPASALPGWCARAGREQQVGARDCCCGHQARQTPAAAPAALGQACCCELRSPDATSGADRTASLSAPGAEPAPRAITVTVVAPPPVAGVVSRPTTLSRGPPGRSTLLVQHTSHLC